MKTLLTPILVTLLALLSLSALAQNTQPQTDTPSTGPADLNTVDEIKPIRTSAELIVALKRARGSIFVLVPSIKSREVALALQQMALGRVSVRLLVDFRQATAPDSYIPSLSRVPGIEVRGLQNFTAQTALLDGGQIITSPLLIQGHSFGGERMGSTVVTSVVAYQTNLAPILRGWNQAPLLMRAGQWLRRQ